MRSHFSRQVAGCLVWAIVCCLISPLAALAARQVRPDKDVLVSVTRNPVAGAQSPVVLALWSFKEELERRSQGTFRVRLLWNTLELPDNETERMRLLNDKIHVIVQPASDLATVTSVLLPLDVWFLFTSPDLESPRAFADSPLMEDVSERVARETGLRILAFWEDGYRHFVLGAAGDSTPSKLRGRQMVAPANPVHQEALTRLGIKPLPLPRGRLHEILRRQEADSADTTLTEIENQALGNEQTQVLLTGHAFEFLCFMASERLYSHLSVTERRWWQDAVTVATRTYRAAFSRIHADQLERAGRNLNMRPLTPDESENFARMAKTSEGLARRMAGTDLYDSLTSAVRESARKQ